MSIPNVYGFAVTTNESPDRHETWTYIRAAELDALRAENERLERDCLAEHERHKQAEASNERLRALHAKHCCLAHCEEADANS